MSKCPFKGSKFLISLLISLQIKYEENLGFPRFFSFTRFFIRKLGTGITLQFLKILPFWSPKASEKKNISLSSEFRGPRDARARDFIFIF